MRLWRSASAGSDSSGRKPSARTGLISSSGSPVPITWYSSSTPFTFAFFIASPVSGRRFSIAEPQSEMREKPRHTVVHLSLQSCSEARVGNREPQKGQTMPAPVSTPTERAGHAASTGDWQAAYELLMEADAQAPLTAPDLALLAGVAYAAGHFDVTIEAWERAYRASAQAGDKLAAAGAAVRIAMHLLFDTALLAPVRGWLTRAERLLTRHEDTSAHAWLAVVRNYE